MPSYSVVPADLDLVVLKGDEFAVNLDFDISLVNYTWASDIFLAAVSSSNNYPGGVQVQGDTVASFNISVISDVNGQLSLSLDEAITAGLSETSLYRWFLRGVAPGAVTRTFVSGKFLVRAP
jgi:hypothetical protein